MTSMERALELQLVSRLRAGDPTAFDAVHDAFNARIYGFLARLTNRRDIAEDLLEETWLRLVVHAPRLRPDSRLGPWLFTVARHLHVSHCRARLLEDSHATSLLGLWPCGSPTPSPLEAAEASEAQLLRNLERLSPLTPDPARALRVRARCRAQLARGRRRSERTARIAEFAQRVVAPAILGGICVLYTVALVVLALRLYGV